MKGGWKILVMIVILAGVFFVGPSKVLAFTYLLPDKIEVGQQEANIFVAAFSPVGLSGITDKIKDILIAVGGATVTGATIGGAPGAIAGGILASFYELNDLVPYLEGSELEKDLKESIKGVWLQYRIKDSGEDWKETQRKTPDDIMKTMGVYFGDKNRTIYYPIKITGLKSKTTYGVEACGIWLKPFENVNCAFEREFTTLGGPVIEAVIVTPSTKDQFWAKTFVNPNGLETNVWFEWLDQSVSVSFEQKYVNKVVPGKSPEKPEGGVIKTALGRKQPVEAVIEVGKEGKYIVRACGKNNDAKEGVCGQATAFDLVLKGGVPTVAYSPVPTIVDTSKYTLIEPLPPPFGSEVDITTGVGKYLNDVITLLIMILGVLAVVMVVIGGIQWMLEESVFAKEDGKKRIGNAIFGLVLALGSYMILNTINPNLVGIELAIKPVEVGYTQRSGAGALGPSTPPPANITTYDSELAAAASANGVDCSFLKALMYRETGGQEKYVRCQINSPTGARGLIQIEPSTAVDFGTFPIKVDSETINDITAWKEFYNKNVEGKGVGNRLTIEDKIYNQNKDKLPNLCDPATNADTAAKLVKRLTTTACNGGSSGGGCNASEFKFIAAAYNGGPGVNQVVGGKFVWESRKETREYVPQVLTNYETIKKNGWGCGS